MFSLWHLVWVQLLNSFVCFWPNKRKAFSSRPLVLLFPFHFWAADVFLSVNKTSHSISHSSHFSPILHLIRYHHRLGLEWSSEHCKSTPICSLLFNILLPSHLPLGNCPLWGQRCHFSVTEINSFSLQSSFSSLVCSIQPRWLLSFCTSLPLANTVLHWLGSLPLLILPFLNLLSLPPLMC